VIAIERCAACPPVVSAVAIAAALGVVVVAKVSGSESCCQSSLHRLHRSSIGRCSGPSTAIAD